MSKNIIYIQADCGLRYKSKDSCSSCGAPKPILKLKKNI